MTIKLICFDFDGTIANTMPWLEKNAVDLFINHYEISKEEATTKYRNTTGLPFEQQVELIFPENLNNKKVISLFEKRKIERMSEQELFPETKDVLTFLKELGYFTAVSSSTTKEIIEDYCKLKGVKKFIDEIVGFRPGFEKGKHHFDFLMKKFNLLSNELVYIGDSKKDMERAYNSGILFYARLGPMFTCEDFQILPQDGDKVKFPCITSLNDIKQLLVY